MCKIIKEKLLLGSNEKIKGGYKFVCFSEAPLASLRNGLVNTTEYSHYSAFGVMFDKRWIFAKGGRPAIYQTDNEFYSLPEILRWRHVRYEPNGEELIDFTWERKWRIKCEALPIDPSYTAIVVPNRVWAQRMLSEHESEQDFRIFQYSLVLDEILAQQYRAEFPWRIFVLG